MGDGRVREHPLDVGLGDGQQLPTTMVTPASTATNGRQSGERQEGHVEHPEERGERRHLRPGRHERRHARRRPLVGVGRPHVERHRRHLEAEADGQQAGGDQRQRVAVPAAERRAMPARFVVPAAPYANATP